MLICEQHQHQHALLPHQLVYAEAVTPFQLWKPSAHLAGKQQLLQVVGHLLVVAHVDHLLVGDVVAGADVVQTPRRAGRLVARGRLQPLGQLEQLLWLDVRVRQQMGLQVRSLVETSVTDRTTVGRLFVVENLVN